MRILVIACIVVFSVGFAIDSMETRKLSVVTACVGIAVAVLATISYYQIEIVPLTYSAIIGGILAKLF